MIWKDTEETSVTCVTAALVSLIFMQTDLFSCFQASQPDELTIEEQEILEVIDDGDMEDWVKVLYKFTHLSGVV